MKLIVKMFSFLNIKNNEIYLLGDFNINLSHNGNYILTLNWVGFLGVRFEVGGGGKITPPV